jgi:D-sedoheptulose 7-phosphate isomerase
MRERIDRGGRLVVFGNGGSATDANDFVLDCVMPPEGWRPVPAISLSAEPAVISAVANDIGAEAVFLRQLIAHASPDDVVIAISTSGNSAGVVTALAEARRRGMMTAGLLGYDGGEIVRRGLVDHAVVIASDYIPRIQEVQATVYHVLRRALEELS